MIGGEILTEQVSAARDSDANFMWTTKSMQLNSLKYPFGYFASVSIKSGLSDHFIFGAKLQFH